MVISSSLDSSLTIVFTLLQNSSFGDKSLGKVDIGMERLLELQRLQPNEGEYRLTIERDATVDNWVNLDVVLSLVDMKGNPSPARLSVRGNTTFHVRSCRQCSGASPSVCTKALSARRRR